MKGMIPFERFWHSKRRGHFDQIKNRNTAQRHYNNRVSFHKAPNKKDLSKNEKFPCVQLFHVELISQKVTINHTDCHTSEHCSFRNPSLLMWPKIIVVWYSLQNFNRKSINNLNEANDASNRIKQQSGEEHKATCY